MLMKKFHSLTLGAVIAALAPLAALAASDMTDAEVRKVDKDNNKITLKHAEIANLQMPPMTMVFRVKDAAMLGKLNPGDKIKFKAEQLDGALVVTAIEPAAK